MKIKEGEVYLLDVNNELNLKDYDSVKVRVVNKHFRYSDVIAIEPMVYPNLADGYHNKTFKVPNALLSKTTIECPIVIRTPINAPTFSMNDRKAVVDAIERFTGSSYQNIADRLSAVLSKIDYYGSFNKFDIKDEDL